MNKKLIRWLWIVFPVLFFTACEYELQETNYVEIEKPQEVIYDIQIKASVNENGEYVIKYPFIKFDFDLPENIGTVYFGIQTGDKSFSYFPASRTAPYIRLNWIEPGKYTLKCDIPASRTNTGSLADISGFEHNGKSFEWKVELQQNLDPDLNLRYERLTDTTFKLFWDKPDTEYGEIDYYSIIKYWNSPPLDITKETSYVVSIPAWNSEYYYVAAFFKENYLYLLSRVYISNY